MKKLTLSAIVLFAVFIAVFPNVSSATYEFCRQCHNGRTAPDLRGLFSSTDELIRAAKKVKNPMMSMIKGNDALLRSASKDLGLK